MGRMLEAFKLISPHRPQLEAEPDSPRLQWPRPEPIAPVPEPVDEPVPFIEVGGPRTVLEASPEVLAARAKLGTKALPPVPVAPAQAPAAPVDAPSRFLTVAFRALPSDPSPLEPVQRRFAPELIAFHRSEHPVSEQYRSLVERIAAQLPAGRSQVVLFTALTPEAGTTTVLLNAAITLARQGRLRVVAVEANLRRPALARRLGLPETPGLLGFLAGTATLMEAIQETGQPNLLALPGGLGSAGQSLSEALPPVLRQLRERFDLVLVDAPCWDGRPEMVALGAACDLVYLVLPESDANTPDSQAWVRTLPQQGARLRACIVTQR